MDFRKELSDLINKFSIENGSNTPDFILADYLVDCLAAYDKVVILRDKWYERTNQEVQEVGSGVGFAVQDQR